MGLSLSEFIAWPGLRNGLAVSSPNADTRCSKTLLAEICWLPQRNLPPTLCCLQTESHISLCSPAIQGFIFCVPLRIDIMYSWSCTHNSTLTSFQCLLMILSLLTPESFLPIYRMTMDQLWPGKNSIYLCHPVNRNHNLPIEIWTTTWKRNSTSNFVFPWAFFLHSSKHFRVLFTSLQ